MLIAYFWGGTEMRYIKLFGVACVVCIWLSGCNSEGEVTQTESNLETPKNEQITLGDLSNLELSEIAGEINLPEHLYEMRSQGEGSWNDEKIYEEFPELIAEYGGPKENELNAEKDIIFETWIDNEPIFTPIGERKDETIWNIKYCSDFLYLEMNDIRQIFTLCPDVVERITGEEWDHRFVWMPDDNAEPIAVYYMEKDDTEDVFYNLDGQEVSLEESIEFVEKELTGNKALPYISTPEMEYRVEYVEVYQYGQNFCYYFTVNMYYNGVKLDTAPGGLPIKNKDGKYMNFISNIDKCTMFSKNELNGIYIFDWLNENQDSVKEVEQNITYEEALQILSGYLSSKHVFKVLDAELVYNFYVEYEEKQDLAEGVNCIVPNWQFKLSTEGIQQYNNIYILINVRTGEVIERYA